MKLYRGCAGAILRVTDVRSASAWLCDNLFFKQIQRDNNKDYQVLESGNCTLYIILNKDFPENGVLKEISNVQADTENEDSTYCTGLNHVALHAAEINEAIKWCRDRNLNIILDGDGSFYNPGVFKEGEKYFNIITPFGAIFEVSEQVSNLVKQEEQPIKGLDHLGVPCADIEQELEFLKGLGFQPLFDTVYNYNEQEGHIACSMVSDGVVTLEVYQFTDKVPCMMNSNEALAGIAYKGVSINSPGGVHFIETEVRDK